MSPSRSSGRSRALPTTASSFFKNVPTSRPRYFTPSASRFSSVPKNWIKASTRRWMRAAANGLPTTPSTSPRSPPPEMSINNCTSPTDHHHHTCPCINPLWMGFRPLIGRRRALARRSSRKNTGKPSACTPMSAARARSLSTKAYHIRPFKFPTSPPRGSRLRRPKMRTEMKSSKS